jgi:hypothetical protein
MMSIMKKLSQALLAFLPFAFLVQPAFAQIQVNTCPEGSDFGNLCGIGAASLPNVIYTVIVILLIAAVLISVIYLIYGGIRWILSGGDKSKLDSARSHIVAAVVGLVVAFAAFFIINVVAQIFLGHSITTLKLPSLGGH